MLLSVIVQNGADSDATGWMSLFTWTFHLIISAAASARFLNVVVIVTCWLQASNPLHVLAVSIIMRNRKIENLRVGNA